MTIEKMHCPYCDHVVDYVDSKKIYGRSYGMVYLCRDCDAYVGVHKGTDKPLGRLANKELRAWKMAAHKAFDPLWRSGKMKRNQAYKWMAEQMELSPSEAHIGMFDVEKCQTLIKICNDLKGDFNNEERTTQSS